MVISSLEQSLSSLSINSFGFEVMPFGHPDVSLHYSLQYLPLKDLFGLARVNRSYNAWSNRPELWQLVSRAMGIPLVAGDKRDRKQDFKVLYPVTISGSKLSAVFGKVVGKIPPISPYWFNKFAENQPNPYVEGGTFQKDFVVLVDPAFIERTNNEQTVSIPFSLRNIRQLSTYPLTGSEYCPVFSEWSWNEAFECSTTYPEHIRVWIMSKSMWGPGPSFATQSARIEETAPRQGYKAMSTRLRAIYDAYTILTTGTCPDGKEMYVRGSETVTINERECRLIIGYFVSPNECNSTTGAGVIVRDDSWEDVGYPVGVVIGAAAESSLPFSSSAVNHHDTA